MTEIQGNRFWFKLARVRVGESSTYRESNVFAYFFLCCGVRQGCVFTKNVSDTALHVYWTGALRIASCNSCCKRWYFTFNGAECFAPLPIDGVVSMATVRHIEGHCNKGARGILDRQLPRIWKRWWVHRL